MQLFTILALIFGISSVAYLALIHKLPFKGDFALKAIPALTLALAAFLLVPSPHGVLLAIGFVLSAIGDINLSFKGEKFFLGGLVSFLLAHVIYCITFSIGSKWNLAMFVVVEILARHNHVRAVVS